LVTVLTASGSPVSDNVSASGWQYLFQGGRQDTATGLYLFEHRDYNPTSGIWMERDPVGIAGGNKNLYGFVENDPAGRTDHSGLMDEALALNTSNQGITGRREFCRS
jgi:RHS repeat-associated protein